MKITFWEIIIAIFIVSLVFVFWADQKAIWHGTVPNIEVPVSGPVPNVVTPLQPLNYLILFFIVLVCICVIGIYKSLEHINIQKKRKRPEEIKI